MDNETSGIEDHNTEPLDFGDTLVIDYNILSAGAERPVRVSIEANTVTNLHENPSGLTGFPEGKLFKEIATGGIDRKYSCPEVVHRKLLTTISDHGKGTEECNDSEECIVGMNDNTLRSTVDVQSKDSLLFEFEVKLQQYEAAKVNTDVQTVIKADSVESLMADRLICKNGSRGISHDNVDVHSHVENLTITKDHEDVRCFQEISAGQEDDNLIMGGVISQERIPCELLSLNCKDTTYDREGRDKLTPEAMMLNEGADIFADEMPELESEATNKSDVKSPGKVENQNTLSKIKELYQNNFKSVEELNQISFNGNFLLDESKGVDSIPTVFPNVYSTLVTDIPHFHAHSESGQISNDNNKKQIACREIVNSSLRHSYKTNGVEDSYSVNANTQDVETAENYNPRTTSDQVESKSIILDSMGAGRKVSEIGDKMNFENSLIDQKEKPVEVDNKCMNEETNECEVTYSANKHLTAENPAETVKGFIDKIVSTPCESSMEQLNSESQEFNNAEDEGNAIISELVNRTECIDSKQQNRNFNTECYVAEEPDVLTKEVDIICSPLQSCKPFEMSNVIRTNRNSHEVFENANCSLELLEEPEKELTSDFCPDVQSTSPNLFVDKMKYVPVNERGQEKTDLATESSITSRSLVNNESHCDSNGLPYIVKSSLNVNRIRNQNLPMAFEDLNYVKAEKDLVKNPLSKKCESLYVCSEIVDDLIKSATSSVPVDEKDRNSAGDGSSFENEKKEITDCCDLQNNSIKDVLSSEPESIVSCDKNTSMEVSSIVDEIIFRASLPLLNNSDKSSMTSVLTGTNQEVTNQKHISYFKDSEIENTLERVCLKKSENSSIIENLTRTNLNNKCITNSVLVNRDYENKCQQERLDDFIGEVDVYGHAINGTLGSLSEIHREMENDNKVYNHQNRKRDKIENDPQISKISGEDNSKIGCGAVLRVSSGDSTMLSAEAHIIPSLIIQEIILKVIAQEKSKSPTNFKKGFSGTYEGTENAGDVCSDERTETSSSFSRDIEPLVNINTYEEFQLSDKENDVEEISGTPFLPVQSPINSDNAEYNATENSSIHNGRDKEFILEILDHIIKAAVNKSSEDEVRLESVIKSSNVAVKEEILDTVEESERCSGKRKLSFSDEREVFRPQKVTKEEENEMDDEFDYMTEDGSSGGLINCAASDKDSLNDESYDEYNNNDNSECVVKEVIDEILTNAIKHGDKEIIVHDIVEDIIASATGCRVINPEPPIPWIVPKTTTAMTRNEFERLSAESISNFSSVRKDPIPERRVTRRQAHLSSVKIEIQESLFGIKEEILDLPVESEELVDLKPDVSTYDSVAAKRPRRSSNSILRDVLLCPVKRESLRRKQVSPSKVVSKSSCSSVQKASPVTTRQKVNVRRSSVPKKGASQSPILVLPNRASRSTGQKPPVRAVARKHTSSLLNEFRRSRPPALKTSLRPLTGSERTSQVARKRSQPPSVAVARKRLKQSVPLAPTYARKSGSIPERKESKRNVAVKSTGKQMKSQVALKRGKPHFTHLQRGHLKIHTGGMQLVDDDKMASPRSNPRKRLHSSPSNQPVKRRPGISIRTCYVKVIRMPVIDRLLQTHTHATEPNICELCEPKRVFLSKESFVMHLKGEHASALASPSPPSNQISNTNRCAGCDRKYFAPSRLAEHMRTCPAFAALPSTSKHPLINIRNRRLSNERARRLSNVRVRALSRQAMLNQTCSTRGQEALMGTDLNDHTIIHSNSVPADVVHNEDPLNVDKESDTAASNMTSCEKSSRFASQMVRRSGKLILRLRRERSTYRCSKCPSIFHEKEYLQEHEALHTSRFFCIICSESFQRKDQLVRHEATHKARYENERASPEVEIIEERSAQISVSHPVRKMTARKSTAARPLLMDKRPIFSAPPRPSTKKCRR